MENHNNQNQNQIINNNRHIRRAYYRDNILMKLNRYCFRFIYDIIHKNLISKIFYLKKLSLIGFHHCMLNERIFKMKISDILSEPKYYRTFNNVVDDHNRKIIDKIYEEKKERNVIKILELTFEELFIIFRRKLNNSEDSKKLEDIKNKIKGLDLLEESNKYEDIQYFINRIEKMENIDKKYIDILKKVCLNYERRFNYKI